MTFRKTAYFVFFAALPQGIWAAERPAPPTAFPGAVGQGAAALGGRGGDVYHVTNLEDYDSRKGEEPIPGSLRDGVESADGPRTIVFDVAGPLGLSRPLLIQKSRLTIAGQTSPGGVTLWGYPVELAECHDVVIRYLRIRTGDFHARRLETGEDATEKQPTEAKPVDKTPSDPKSSEAKPPAPKPGGRQPPKKKPAALAHDLDASSANGVDVGAGCQRVILDHLSVSWGMDETLSVTNSRDVTVQHTIIAESLNHSFHPKGAHGFGTLLRGTLTPRDQRAGVGGYTFFGNLWAHHKSRNPSVGGQQRLARGQLESRRGRTDVNIVNNVMYDWGDLATYRSLQGDVRINLIGNFYVSGPSTANDYIFKEGEAGRTFVFQEDNFHDADRDATHNGQRIDEPAEIQREFRDFGRGDRLVGPNSGRPFNFLGNLREDIVPAADAYQQVVDSVGASLWRDAADRRVIESLVQRTGRLFDSQEEFRDAEGKLPGIDGLATASRPADFDTDGDGMPTEFEASTALDRNDPADRNGSDLSPEGYTNLEVYLNSLVRQEPPEP